MVYKEIFRIGYLYLNDNHNGHQDDTSQPNSNINQI